MYHRPRSNPHATGSTCASGNRDPYTAGVSGYSQRPQRQLPADERHRPRRTYRNENFIQTRLRKRLDTDWNRRPPFTGSFDGNEYTIKGLWIDSPGTDFVGLFGYISRGTIKNLSIKVATEGITGQNYVGALAGYTFYADISDCSATGGKVTGNYYIGGLVGRQSGSLTGSYASVGVEGYDYTGGLTGQQNGTINGCFATGGVKATVDDASVGGLVGYQPGDGQLSNSYATGKVEATANGQRAGGLVGAQKGTITTCYATGKVEATGNNPIAGGLVGENDNGTINSSYFDKETTGMTDGVGEGGQSGVIALSTEQMIVASSYANWTISAPGSGSEAQPWVIGDRTYPYLYWQTSGIVYVPPITPPVPPKPKPEPEPQLHTVTVPTVEGATTYPAAGEYLVQKGTTMTLLLFLPADYDQSDVKVVANGDTIHSEESKLNALAYTFLIPVTADTELEVTGVEKNNPTGITENAKAEDVKVWTSPGCIHVSSKIGGSKQEAVGSKQHGVRIYTMMGRLVFHSQLSTVDCQLPSGAYIVVVGEKVVKAWVNN